MSVDYKTTKPLWADGKERVVAHRNWALPHRATQMYRGKRIYGSIVDGVFVPDNVAEFAKLVANAA